MKIEIYNNIGISLVAFLSTIREYEEINYAKAMLIQPLLLHKPLTNYMKDERVKIRGIEDLILSKIECFLNFNNRFIAFLPLSLNTILFAEKLGFIKTKQNKIIIVKDKLEKFDFNNNKLGKRAQKIVQASKIVSNMLQENSGELYFKLRIEL